MQSNMASTCWTAYCQHVMHGMQVYELRAIKRFMQLTSSLLQTQTPLIPPVIVRRANAAIVVGSYVTSL